MTKVFVVDNPGFYNKGDAALVLGALITLKTLDDASIDVASRNPQFDSVRCDANLIDESAVAPHERPMVLKLISFGTLVVQYLSVALIRRALRINWIPKAIVHRHLFEEYVKCDVLIMALDDSFTTLYGFYGFLAVCSRILIGKTLGKYVVLYAGSVGPFNRRVYEIVGSFCLNKTDLITLREEVSLEYLKRIGVKRPHMEVTADLAFVLKPASVERAMEILSLEGISTERRPLIGVSLSRVISRWAFPSLRDRNEKYRAYLQIMASMIDHLAEHMSATIIFIPQVIGATSELDDRLAAKDIYALCKNKDKIKLILNEYSPEELRAMTGHFDMFVGTRTHAAISAAVMGVPFLALEYESHKTRGIIGRMLQCEDLVYDIKELSPETLHSRIDEVWKNRDRIRMELHTKTATMEKRALRNGELVAQLLKEKRKC